MEKYLSKRHLHYTCMFSSAIIIEYELEPKSFTMLSVQTRCKNGIKFCVKPLLKSAAEGRWTCRTIRAHLRLRRMQFNGFPVWVHPGSAGDYAMQKEIS